MGCEASCPYSSRKSSKIGWIVFLKHSLYKVSRFEIPVNAILVRPKKVEQLKRPESFMEYPLLEMTYEQKDILIVSIFFSNKINLLQKHYRDTMLEQKPDIFHKTMLMCMQSSPKLNEIIACQIYCYRDLTKWPKLNQLWSVATL